MSDNVNAEQGGAIYSTGTYADNPIGTDYNPRGDDLSPEEAADRINALFKRAQSECYLPDDPETNHQNDGRVRALSQALTLLERAGIYPKEDVYLNDQEEMVNE